jgi:PPK2 family polyphosphate:nucleotide phosphotransferase
MHLDRFRVRAKDLKALRRHRPDDTGPAITKEAARDRLKKGVERLAKRQELLYAQDRYALLVIFQGMDAAGKDSAIKHVMSGVNPLGTDVHSFKQPTIEDLQHDYLWRAVKALPARGRIGIFNRSYYEDVLVVRVHPHLLEAAKLPSDRVTPRIWKERYKDIRAFERHLRRNGTIIVKFFMYVSRAEQARRLLERVNDPAKNWKFSESDVAERRKWNQYLKAYGEALAATSRDRAPWYIVPADHKWFAHALVAEVIEKTLEDLPLAYPRPTDARRRHLRALRRELTRAAGSGAGVRK